MQPVLQRLLATRRPLPSSLFPRASRRTIETNTKQPAATSSISRLEARLPRFLHRYTVPLRTAPVSHITAFLLLHELTAIIPLFGLAGAFHYFNYLPPFISEWRFFSDGFEKMGNWMRKKGWVGEKGKWGRGEQGVKIVVELATAYAITKALLPLRLVGSVWATPWFARWTVLPATRWFGRVFGRKKKGLDEGKKAVDAVGTGAVGGGVLPKGK